MQIPYETVVAKIVEQSELSKEDVEGKVQEKMSQLSGLISKEGAALIIANELNLNIHQEVAQQPVKIKDIVAGSRDLTFNAKILQKWQKKEFEVNNRKGTVANIFVGDETGRMRVVMWGETAKVFDELAEGDVVQVKGGYARENNNYTEVHANDRSEIIKNPEGVSVDVQTPQRERKSIQNISEEDNQVELLGTLVELQEPRFFEVCKTCNKRIKADDEGNFSCDEHPDVPIAYSYVLNGVLDDGTDNIRSVFFRDVAMQLLQKSHDEIIALKDNLQEFESLKQQVLGSIVKVQGRVSKNTMFDRLEFLANNVDLSPDPEEELKRVKDAV